MREDHEFAPPKTWRSTVWLATAVAILAFFLATPVIGEFSDADAEASATAPPVSVVYRPPAPLAQVSRWFEAPEHAYGPGHRGIDFQLATGSQVRAPASGEVSFSGQVAGRPVLVLRHGDGLRSTLEPVDSNLRTGDKVEVGAVVGVLRIDGSHCLPAACLHWGVRAGEDYLDPLSLLRQPRAIRLLPLP